jgi:predicted alpha/beta superfamily hydrolase
MRTPAGIRHRIQLGWPDALPPAGGYPAMLLLDGQTTYPMAQAMAQPPSGQEPPRDLEAALLVSLTYPEDAFDSGLGVDSRTRDYTLPGPSAPPGAGGVEAFLDFIENQLLPELASRFPLNPDRLALFGHSYGGLCALYAFFTRPALFGTTIAASPSIWWQQGMLLNEEQRFVAALPPDTSRRHLLITVGAREQRSEAELAAMEPRRRERAESSNMVGRAAAMAGRLAGLGAGAPQLEFVSFAGEDHGSVISPAMRRAVRFALGR